MTTKTTGIEWVRSESGEKGWTWNPVTGCTKISAGCDNCYAERTALRMQNNPVLNKAKRGNPYRNGFEVTLQEHRLDEPLRKKKPAAIFVNSMSDLFHAGVPKVYIKQVFEIMEQAHWHTFQILTKRADRLARLALELPWPKNVWMGVSVENQDVYHRIEHLMQVPAQIRWLSMEPLLGPVPDIPHLAELDWIVVGGESGPRARPMHPDWARDVRDQCQVAAVPFFFKQWGEHDSIGVRVGKKTAGRMLDGRIWDQMPKQENFQA